jgi:RNA polymerase sigma-B factor
LLIRYHGDGDLRAREELIVRCVPLARQLAARYRHLGEPEEDLEQVACGADLTQSEIGQRIGVSQMQVSRLLRRALERLRAKAA